MIDLKQKQENNSVRNHILPDQMQIEKVKIATKKGQIKCEHWETFQTAKTYWSAIKSI